MSDAGRSSDHARKPPGLSWESWNYHKMREGMERGEFHNIVTWDRLAEVCGRYLGKGQQVALEGRLQTRTWDDEKGLRHWKTEIVASSVEMLSGRKKKDYAAESAADAIEAAGADGADGPDASAADGTPCLQAEDPIPEELAA